MKKILSVFLLVLSAASLQAAVLLQDSVNYPYTNGPIAGQGPVVCLLPAHTRL
jgi:hypothetical protein